MQTIIDLLIKVGLIIILFCFSVEDIRVQSISFWHVLFANAVYLLNCIFSGAVFTLQFWIGILIVIGIAIYGKLTDGIGMGDVCVILLLVFAVGLKYMVYSTIIASVLMFLFVIVMLFFPRGRKIQRVPFIPFLTVAVSGVLICA